MIAYDIETSERCQTHLSVFEYCNNTCFLRKNRPNKKTAFIDRVPNQKVGTKNNFTKINEKNHISTNKCGTQHPFTGQNIKRQLRQTDDA